MVRDHRDRDGTALRRVVSRTGRAVCVAHDRRPARRNSQGAAAMKRIAVAQPVIDDTERLYVMQCLDRAQLSCGPFVERFEAGLASLVGTKHAIACCNGTAALHLTLAAL